ncbi:MAG: hypothetical protein LLG05_08465 [Porphyromonadaceae bacterium]|nr:hypothetical protein [Porphyromonadaceae bacterium]
MKKEEFLAMSLPTGLKIKDIFSPIKLTGIMDNEYYFGSSLSIEGAENVDKIILHPLSDLTKEIEHKGERFIPKDRIGLVHDISGNHILNFRTGERIDILSLPYFVVERLIEWHFDIADLISKGEAIDVNTLPENPYK